MSKIHVLYLGTDSTPPQPSPAAQVELEYTTHLTRPERPSYEMVILDRTPDREECLLLHRVTRAHTLFVSDRVNIGKCSDYCKCKHGRRLKTGDIPQFLEEYASWFFKDSYGEKYEFKNLAVSDSFRGEIYWEGNYALRLTGEFGEGFRQVAFWRNNIPIEAGQTIDFWLEYAETAGVELRLKMVLFAGGSLDRILKVREFTEEDLRDIVQLRAEQRSFLFVSVLARGKGSLDIVALHDRYSRGRFGFFLPGGDRYVTSRREEIFCYFDPGDRKPPLNVYFSGYKTRQGFEGYKIMHDTGAPFLLVSDARLEGGSFYLGSPEYEELMVSVLKSYLDQLGFTEKDLILSGISMGSTGALYYGCALQPHAIIVGKPLVNVGTIAANERLIRPGGFPTSLDVLLTQGGELTGEAEQRLNEHFWEKFRAADWSDTKLIVSYMLEDDYDSTAYENMVEYLSTRNGRIYGRGLHGRHNDNTWGIVQWFISQHHKILSEDFGEYSSVFRRGIEQ